MSEFFSFVILWFATGIAEFEFNFNFQPAHIFGFIILWQLLQLTLLWLERRRKQAKKASAHIEDTTEDAITPIQSQTQAETQVEEHTPQPTMDEIEFKLEQERNAWVIKKQQSRVPPPTLDIPHSASHIEIAIQASRAIEEALEKKLGAYGKGLHSKLSSVEEKISSSMVKQIRWIATIRNNTVHTTQTSFEKSDFIRATQSTLSYLNNL